MNLHEYQGKDILSAFGVRVQRGIVADTAEKAVAAAQRLSVETGTRWWVIKAQVHAGGRGKGGGVKLAKSLGEVKTLAGQILGMRLITPQTTKEGKRVNQVLVAEDVYYPGESDIQEYYISVLLNRAEGKPMVVYSPEGGVDIETVATHTPNKIYSQTLAPGMGILPFQARQIAFTLGLRGQAFKELVGFVTALCQAYEKSDASLFEINPVLKTSDDKITAVDAKVTLDNSALFRHKDYANLRDTREEDPTEVEAGRAGLNFIKLDGNVGCMVNGAGLAMATMDIIKLSGGNPANFLDIGGTADAKRVEKGFRIILADSNVKAILINIFGGIVRCDRVAQGIIDACKNMGDTIPVPIIVRLQGTHAELAEEMIDKSGLSVHAAVSLQAASDKVGKALTAKA